MRVISCGPHLHQLTRFPRAFPINACLVRGDDGFTLVDTGIGGSAGAYIAIATRLGAPIVRIALTHAHPDHAGSLDALHAALPDAEVAISMREARLLAGDRSLEADELMGKLRGGSKICTTKPSRMLQPGDRLGSLEVIATPGHTPGHISFLDTRDRSLIAGDAFQTQGGIAVSGTIRPLFPFPAFATWHRPTALRSAHALLALKPSRLLVGHGRALESPEAAMKQAIADAQHHLAGGTRKAA